MVVSEQPPSDLQGCPQMPFCLGQLALRFESRRDINLRSRSSQVCEFPGTHLLAARQIQQGVSGVDALPVFSPINSCFNLDQFLEVLTGQVEALKFLVPLRERQQPTPEI